MPPEDVTTRNRTSTEDTLDQILMHVKHMDNRDRMRTWGGFAKTLIWIGIVVGSSWYFVKHGAEITKTITEQAAAAAAKYTQSSGQELMDQLIKQYGAGGQKQP